MIATPDRHTSNAAPMPIPVRTAATTLCLCAAALIAGHPTRTPVRAGERTPRGAAPGREPTRIPTVFEDGRFYVPVSTAAAVHGGSGPVDLGWFILDTGAGATLLDAGVARRLGLTMHELRSAHGAGAGSIREATASGIPLEVGSVAFTPRELVVAPLDSLLAPSTGRHVAGIIGSQFFAEHTVGLSAPWRTIAVDMPEPPEPVAAIVLPIELRDAIPYVAGTLQLGGPQGAEPLRVRLLLDLGAKAPLLLTERALARAGGVAALPPHVLASLGAGIGGETRYYFSRARRLTLDATGGLAEADSVPVGFSAFGTLRDTAFDGLLGAPFLARYAVRIDYGARRVILVPSTLDASREPDFDESGLFLNVDLTASRRRVYVRRVVRGSPADRVDVRPGDELLQIDGQSVADQPLSMLRRVLRGAVGNTVHVRGERGGHVFDVVLRLRPLI